VVEGAAEHGEGAADLADGIAVVFVNVGDGLAEGPGAMGGVWGELAQEPNQLKVASSFPFQEAI